MIPNHHCTTKPICRKLSYQDILSKEGGGNINFNRYRTKPLKEIDPNIRIAGSFPLQASFNATGLDVEAPTLILTGERDIVVIPYAQGLLTQYNLILQRPAWYIGTKNSTHTTPPTVELARNDYAGITVAFILYLGQDNSAASRYCAGTPYIGTQDDAFIQQSLNPITNLIRVQRNSLADRLSPL